MKQIRNFIVAAALVLASGLNAAPSEKPGPYAPIVAMMAFVDLGMMSINVTMDDNQAAKPQPDIVDFMQKQFPKALAAAGNHRELRSAVKSYYSAATALFGALDPQGDEPVILYKSRIGNLETRVKQAEADVKTELDALGASS